MDENLLLALTSSESLSNISSCSRMMNVSLLPMVVSFFSRLPLRWAEEPPGSLNGVAPAKMDDLVLVIRSLYRGVCIESLQVIKLSSACDSELLSMFVCL